MKPLLFSFTLLLTCSLNAQISSFWFETKADASNSTESSGVGVNGTFTFHHTTGLLELNLNNISGTGGYTDGYLTGFGFNLPTGLDYVSGSFTQALALGSSGEPDGIDFHIFDGNFSLPPYGTFELGAGTGPTATGGNKKPGLAGGYSANFTFQFTGPRTPVDEIIGFNAEAFFNDTVDDLDMVFRFQALPDGGSEKVAFAELPPAPEPSTYGAMAAAGLIGVIAVRRFKRRSIAPPQSGSGKAS